MLNIYIILKWEFFFGENIFKIKELNKISIINKLGRVVSVSGLKFC